MKILHLHIGHGKTGSSYIQACLRLNRKALSQSGIIYAKGEDYSINDPGSISSGNALCLFQSKSSFDEALAKNIINDNEQILFSSENILHSFIESDGEKYLEEITEKHGFEKVKILMFIRNPINRAVSIWQQSIKRHGNYDYDLNSIDQYLENRKDILFFVEEFINRINNCKIAELTIKNYNNCSANLMEAVASWLEIPVEIFKTYPPASVNRSLTYSELVFQMNLNKKLGMTGSFFADPLCEKLPEVKLDTILPSIDIQKKYGRHKKLLSTDSIKLSQKNIGIYVI